MMADCTSTTLPKNDKKDKKLIVIHRQEMKKLHYSEGAPWTVKCEWKKLYELLFKSPTVSNWLVANDILIHWSSIPASSMMMPACVAATLLVLRAKLALRWYSKRGTVSTGAATLEVLPDFITAGDLAEMVVNSAIVQFVNILAKAEEDKLDPSNSRLSMQKLAGNAGLQSTMPMMRNHIVHASGYTPGHVTEKHCSIVHQMWSILKKLYWDPEYTAMICHEAQQQELEKYLPPGVDLSPLEQRFHPVDVAAKELAEARERDGGQERESMLQLEKVMSHLYSNTRLMLEYTCKVRRVEGQPCVIYLARLRACLTAVVKGVLLAPGVTRLVMEPSSDCQKCKCECHISLWACPQLQSYLIWLLGAELKQLPNSQHTMDQDEDQSKNLLLQKRHSHKKRQKRRKNGFTKFLNRQYNKCAIECATCVLSILVELAEEDQVAEHWLRFLLINLHPDSVTRPFGSVGQCLLHSLFQNSYTDGFAAAAEYGLELPPVNWLHVTEKMSQSGVQWVREAAVRIVGSSIGEVNLDVIPASAAADGIATTWKEAPHDLHFHGLRQRQIDELAALNGWHNTEEDDDQCNQHTAKETVRVCLAEGCGVFPLGTRATDCMLLPLRVQNYKESSTAASRSPEIHQTSEDEIKQAILKLAGDSQNSLISESNYDPDVAELEKAIAQFTEEPQNSTVTRNVYAADAAETNKVNQRKQNTNVRKRKRVN